MRCTRESWLSRLLCLLLAAALARGCAQTRPVTFTSAPPGATVKVGKQTGITPCTLNLPLKRQRATISLPGYPAQRVKIKPVIDFGAQFAKATLWPVAGVSGVGALITGVPLALFYCDDEDDSDWPSYTAGRDDDGGDDDGDDDETPLLIAFGVSLALLLFSGSVLELAEETDDTRLEPDSVHVEFVKTRGE